MKSNSVQDELIERFKLQERYATKFKTDTRLTLTANTRASSGKDGLITVQIDDKDPQFAAELANAHVDELQKLLARLAVTEAQQRRAFFEKQLTQVKEKFTEAEQALRATGVSSSVLKSNPASALAAVAAFDALVTLPAGHGWVYSRPVFYPLGEITWNALSKMLCTPRAGCWRPSTSVCPWRCWRWR